MAVVQIQLLRRGNELRRGCHRQPLITRFAALCITPRPTVGAVGKDRRGHKLWYDCPPAIIVFWIRCAEHHGPYIGGRQTVRGCRGWPPGQPLAVGLWAAAIRRLYCGRFVNRPYGVRRARTVEGQPLRAFNRYIRRGWCLRSEYRIDGCRGQPHRNLRRPRRPNAFSLRRRWQPHRADG